MLKAATDELLAAYPGIGYLDLVPDTRLHDDACIVETEIGIVEASIEGQIAALGRAFHQNSRQPQVTPMRQFDYITELMSVALQEAPPLTIRGAGDAGDRHDHQGRHPVGHDR